MPVELERKLKATAKRRGYGKERTGAYVYGTLAKIKKQHIHGASTHDQIDVDEGAGDEVHDMAQCPCPECEKYRASS